MKTIYRRDFIKRSAGVTATAMVAPAYIKNLITDSPNERINIAVIGIAGNRERVRGIIAGRGIVHVRNYSELPNVRIKTICDVDERLFAGMSTTVEELNKNKPGTEPDFRKILEDKEIDIISLATPDHWHALQTIWACQAGKHVYVEKPTSHNVFESRKMVDAAKKYDRIVQSGICYRSSNAVKEGIKFIHEGKLGKPYMARGITWRYREPIGKFADSQVPEGVHWDLFLGPAPMRPFNLNRFYYHWHWYWDTGTTDMGNNGIYRMDTVRWALNKNTHPVKIQCTGGLFGRDDQEVPNMLAATYEYDDGMIIQNEIRCMPTNPEGMPKDDGVCFVYSDQGWMSLSGNGYKTYFGPKNEPGPARSDDDFPPEVRSNGFKNLVNCVRSGRKEDLDNPMIEGHYSSSLVNLALISYRTGRKLIFNPAAEKFVNDKEADKYLTRDYRKPYVVPQTV